MVSEALVRELQIILREVYGKDLGLQEVHEIATAVVDYFSLLKTIQQRSNQSSSITNQSG
jgi:hypothetical protein